MRHSIVSLDPQHRTLALVEEVGATQPLRWLAAGWSDLRSAPAASLGYGLVFVLVSYLITLAVILNQWFYLLLPLLCGFFLVAPALGLGLYDISRQLERGEQPTLAHAMGAMAVNRFHVATLGAFLTVMLLAWIMSANLIFVGLAGGITPRFDNALGYLLSLHNLPLLAAGTIVGAGYALVVFAVTAVSVPMLLDQEDTDVMSAMQISAMACLYNWRPMLLWAALIVVLIAAGFATLYVGLIIAFPVIGHATWHAYRDLVRQ